LPLAVRWERSRIGRIRVLTYPLHDWGSFYSPVGPDPGFTLAIGLDYLREAPRDWDLLELRWIDPEDPVDELTGRALEAVGFAAYRSIWDRTAIVDLAGGWDRYWASRSAGWRNNLRRDERRLATRGRVEYVRYRPRGDQAGEGDPRWDLYDACEQVARRSWQGASRTGTTLSHPSIRPFLRDTHVAAARRGEVDVNLLYLDGQPLAFSYNYHRGGRVYGLRTGFDATLARESPGSQLHASVLRDGVARGDRLYDLGVGSMHAKRRFATRVVPIVRYSHFVSASPRVQLLRLKRWFQARAARQELQGSGDA
jgi:CelD/BcsL family acetyltransferase involved in cellulose biosynthesis